MYLKILQKLSLLAIIFLRNRIPVNPNIKEPVDRASTEIPKITFAGMMYLDFTDPTISLGSTLQNMIRRARNIRKEKVNSD